jgi:hypothetical protein
MPFDHVTDAAASEYERQSGFVMDADMFLPRVTTDGSARLPVQPNSDVITVGAGSPASEIVQYAEEINAGVVSYAVLVARIGRQLLFGYTTWM